MPAEGVGERGQSEEDAAGLRPLRGAAREGGPWGARPRADERDLVQEDEHVEGQREEAQEQGDPPTLVECWHLQDGERDEGGERDEDADELTLTLTLTLSLSLSLTLSLTLTLTPTLTLALTLTLTLTTVKKSTLRSRAWASLPPGPRCTRVGRPSRPSPWAAG